MEYEVLSLPLPCLQFVSFHMCHDSSRCIFQQHYHSADDTLVFLTLIFHEVKSDTFEVPYCNFPESASERISKMGRYFIKLWQKCGMLFVWLCTESLAVF